MSTLAAKLLPGKRIHTNSNAGIPSETTTDLPRVFRCRAYVNAQPEKIVHFSWRFSQCFCHTSFIRGRGVRWRSIDVPSLAPYNEKNQLFGEKPTRCRWS